MAKITIKDKDSFVVEDGTRLILAIKDHGVDILHRCGGYAKCTTCRVDVADGEPTKMTEAELEKLQGQGDVGEYRLSCQISCDHDMTVEPLMTLSNTDLDDAGSRPEDDITPEPVWTEKPD